MVPAERDMLVQAKGNDVKLNADVPGILVFKPH
jgi:hypothetical protein